MQYRICPLLDDPKAVQRWKFELGTERTYDYVDAKAVLLDGPREKGEGQRLLVLEGSVMKERTDVCSAKATNIREKLKSLGIGAADSSGLLRLTRDVVLTSPGLACNVMYGGSKNGWDDWKLVTGDWKTGPSLDDAFRLSRKGERELLFYRLPDDAYRAE